MYLDDGTLLTHNEVADLFERFKVMRYRKWKNERLRYNENPAWYLYQIQLRKDLQLLTKYLRRGL
jgi:hypothetical protein